MSTPTYHGPQDHPPLPPQPPKPKRRGSKLVGLLIAGALAVGALAAAPALVPVSGTAGGSAITTALSPLAPDTAEAKKKKKKKKSKKAKAKAKKKAKAKAKKKAKAKAKKAKATKAEYRKIKSGMSLAKVRKIIGSKGKRTWYYESTYSYEQCDDGYYDGYWEQTEVWVEDGYYDYVEIWVDGYYEGDTWVDGYYEYVEEWVDGHVEYEDTWVEGDWVDGGCYAEDLTTVYKDYSWKNTNGGYVYVNFVDGRVDSKSWYS